MFNQSIRLLPSLVQALHSGLTEQLLPHVVLHADAGAVSAAVLLAAVSATLGCAARALACVCAGAGSQPLSHGKPQ